MEFSNIQIFRSSSKLLKTNNLSTIQTIYGHGGGYIYKDVGLQIQENSGNYKLEFFVVGTFLMLQRCSVSEQGCRTCTRCLLICTHTEIDFQVTDMSAMFDSNVGFNASVANVTITVCLKTPWLISYMFIYNISRCLVA